MIYIYIYIYIYVYKERERTRLTQPAPHPPCTCFAVYDLRFKVWPRPNRCGLAKFSAGAIEYFLQGLSKAFLCSKHVLRFGSYRAAVTGAVWPRNVWSKRPQTCSNTLQCVTIHPTHYAPHPTPYTLHLTPCTPHPAPYTLHPAPCTLHPAPYTLHPTQGYLEKGIQTPMTRGRPTQSSR